MRDEKILIVDDDPAIRRLIWKSLQSTGILIYQTDSVEKTIAINSRVSFDLFLLDISLEHENDGYHLAQLIREENPTVPIVFLSGKSDEKDMINGYEIGADHYITKPFSPALLKAQIVSILDRRNVLREKGIAKPEGDLWSGMFRFDQKRYQFFKNDQPIKLSSKEIMLMRFFMENPDQVFSKEQIYSNVWQDGQFDANTVMVFINHLRNKIEDEPKQARFLKTVWGIGYTFLPEGDAF